MPTNCNKKEYVTAAKPAVAGAVYWRTSAAAALPTNAKDAIPSTGWACLGYCSEDGLTNENEIDRETIKAWGGDTVLVVHNGLEDRFSFTLIEEMSSAVQRFLHSNSSNAGSSVSGSLDGTGVSMAVAVKNEDNADEAIAIDMVLRGGILKRIVIPLCHISEVGEVTYADGEAVAHEVTVTCLADDDGVYHYEYFDKPSAGSASGSGTGD